MDELMMGCCAADITPNAPMHMIGFGDMISEGVEHPLAAQATVWSLAGRRCALVAIDHIGFGAEHAASLRARLAALLGTGREQVMLCFAHTHSAPNDDTERAYAEWVDGRVMEAARSALCDMHPVRAAWGCAEVDIGVNRRAGGGALDRRAGVLKVADAATGELRLLLLRLTAHCNALKGDNRRISPDWFGAARDVLSARWGCPVVLTQGASGNVAPRFFASRIDPPDADDTSGRFVRTENALSEMARAVLSAVEPVVEALEPHDMANMEMYSAHGELCAAVPDAARARAIAEEARREAGIDGTAWLSEVTRLQAAGVTAQRERVEMQFFRLGEGCLIGVPNELMCELALEVRARAGELAFLGGYTNGCSGYLPTAEEDDRGGYEVLWSMLDYFMYHGRVVPLDRDAADRVIGMALDGLRA